MVTPSTEVATGTSGEASDYFPITSITAARLLHLLLAITRQRRYQEMMGIRLLNGGLGFAAERLHNPIY